MKRDLFFIIIIIDISLPNHKPFIDRTILFKTITDINIGDSTSEKAITKNEAKGLFCI